MATAKITKRVVDAAEAHSARYTIYDEQIPGFGLRVYPTGMKSYVFEYRPGEGGRRTPVKRVTIGLAASADGKKQPDFTADGARKEADRLRAIVLTGGDPQCDKAARRLAPTVQEVAQAFLTDHVEAKRKASTKTYYQDLLDRIILPEIGKLKAKDVRPADVARLHRSLKDRPFLANRVLAVIGAMYGFAEGAVGLVPEGTNPTKRIEKFEEPKRDRLLTSDELVRLASAMREAETIGIPWELSPDGKHKHLPKTRRVTVVSPAASAALRLLIFTGARLREILHLR